MQEHPNSTPEKQQRRRSTADTIRLWLVALAAVISAVVAAPTLLVAVLTLLG
jgi:hypothetical protein